MIPKIRFYRILFTALLFLQAIFSAIAFLPLENFILEFFVHFRLQYLAIALFGLGIGLITRQWLILALSAICVFLNFAAIVPFYYSRQPEIGPTPEDQPKLRVVAGNIYTVNEHPEQFLDIVLAIKPQILGITELSADQHQLFERRSGLSPAIVDPQTQSNFGIGIYTNPTQLQSGTIDEVAGFNKTLWTTISFEGRTVRFILFHVPPPLPQALKDLRDTQMRALAEYIQKSSDLPTIACGDMNATPWTEAYRDFVKRSGLGDAQVGFGIHRTWKTFAGLSDIPIDYCFVSEEFHVTGFETFDIVGSDHRGVYVEVSLKIEGLKNH